LTLSGTSSNCQYLFIGFRVHQYQWCSFDVVPGDIAAALTLIGDTTYPSGTIKYYLERFV